MTMKNGNKIEKKRMPRREDDEQVVYGSGDVFSDLGLSLTPEEEFKYAVARTISGIITEKGYTQVQVAEILGADQAKVSQITRGQLLGFSTDRLIRYLLTLGIDINVNFMPSDHPHGRVRVAAVG